MIARAPRRAPRYPFGMRALLVAAAILTSSVAAARPALVTSVTVTMEEPASADDRKIYPVVAHAFDACWRKAGAASVRIVVDGGKITSVAVIDRGERRAMRCVTKALTGLAVPTADQRQVAVLRISSRSAADRARQGTGTVNPNATSDRAGTFDTGERPHGRSDTGPVGAGERRGPAPRVAFGATHTTDLAVEVVDRVVKRRAGLYRACYQRELAKDPGLAGTLVVELAVGADGKVTGATVGAASTIASPGLSTCVTGQVGRLVFPVPSAATTITITVRFSAD